jgi:hypothetical protein
MLVRTCFFGHKRFRLAFLNCIKSRCYFGRDPACHPTAWLRRSWKSGLKVSFNRITVVVWTHLRSVSKVWYSHGIFWKLYLLSIIGEDETHVIRENVPGKRLDDYRTQRLVGLFASVTCIQVHNQVWVSFWKRVGFPLMAFRRVPSAVRIVVPGQHIVDKYSMYIFLHEGFQDQGCQDTHCLSKFWAMILSRCFIWWYGTQGCHHVGGYILSDKHQCPNVRTTVKQLPLTCNVMLNTSTMWLLVYGH